MTSLSPMDAWIPHISKLWSAAIDEKCQTPSSDDYREWTLTQLKREIAQRNLKINQKKRNKDSYVKLLLASDGVQHSVQDSNGRSVCHIESVDIQRFVNPQAAPQEMLSFPATPSTQPPQHHFTSLASQPKQVSSVIMSPQQLQMQKQSASGAISMLHPQPSLPQVVAVVPDEEDSDIPVGLVEVEQSRCSILQKRKRTSPGDCIWSAELDKKQHEYLCHELAMKATKLDIQTRRLELESKRDKQNQELQQVQLELAQEQLKQMKLNTQKIRIEWVIEQALHKKRLRDAGICEQDILAIV